MVLNDPPLLNPASCAVFDSFAYVSALFGSSVPETFPESTAGSKYVRIGPVLAADDEGGEGVRKQADAAAHHGFAVTVHIPVKADTGLDHSHFHRGERAAMADGDRRIVGRIERGRRVWKPSYVVAEAVRGAGRISIAVDANTVVNLPGSASLSMNPPHRRPDCRWRNGRSEPW